MNKRKIYIPQAAPKKSENQNFLFKLNQANQDTLQGLIGKKSVKWSFSKAARFSIKVKTDNVEYQLLKSSIGEGRAAGFGYGKRWEPVNSHGKDSPASTTYTLAGSLDRYIVGGKISPSRIQVFDARVLSPGPGSYDLKSHIGKGLSCSFKSRHERLSRDYSPPPGSYNPKHGLVEKSRFNSISFGGKPASQNAKRVSTPGPGSYDISSKFVKPNFSFTPKRLKAFRKLSM